MRRAVARPHWSDFELRAQGISEHLSTALKACEDGRFNAGFAAIRVAMEHKVLDRLLMLGTRYEQTIKDVDDARFERWESDPASWGEGVESLLRTSRGVVVTRTGLNVVDADGNTLEQISPYLPVLEDHRPTLGPPSAQHEFYNGIGNL